MKVKYKSSIYGMSPTCKTRPTVKAGSMSCEECEHFRGKAFGFIGKETAVGGRKIDLYGGWVECAAPGYEIEEPCDAPNPESATKTQLPIADATLKVGDWVEVESSCVKGKTFVSMIKEMLNQEHYTVRVNSYFGGYTVYGVMESQIVRKLKPSEVIVNIGRMSGTVRPVSTNGTHIWFHLIGVDDKTIATIRISCLDTPTRSLVESLLKAQEEEK